MTIGEVKNMFKDQYADVEYYRNIFNCTHQIDFNLTSLIFLYSGTYPVVFNRYAVF